ncbi:uroporphyrinogen-III C-methyltransferase [Staphylococcus delphini]|uniref:uroporphyrinogen-III C-methyltransferase n=1 Tax=Staphylococcus delphini TaxID=53344 RepID=UPI0012D32847|nr:uroporphyrinogen-III C-methyltransferase [Staphylococcus delphini]MTV21750.1 uroporphyrinogen-III C-methyltransferase [Staphylococcus delphini]
MSALTEVATKVYLVGAGPGNPCLLTKKAEGCIQKADVILYDQLVNPFLLQLSRPDAEWIHVGKTPYTRTTKQARINALLVEKAQTAQVVVRLKGGDPAIFGRVTEEVDTLRAHEIPFEIVPGVTAASAAMSQLGRGLTERGVATHITFTTGHFKNNEENDIDLKTLANDGTLAIYMGIKRLPELMRTIQQQIGIDFPVAIIFNATRVNQHVVTGTVTTIVDRIASLPERMGPGITIVGHVVRDLDETVWDSVADFDTVLIKGERQRAIEVAYEWAEAGHAVLIDDRDFSDLHPTQEEKIACWVDEMVFTREISLTSTKQ